MENQNERISSLRLKVRDKLFSKSGDLKIKCTAAIDTIYWRSNEESIQGLSERSYNLNIRDNGWNSGLYPEKKFFFFKKREWNKILFFCIFSVGCDPYSKFLSVSVALPGSPWLGSPLNKVQHFPLNKVQHFLLHKVQHFALNEVLHFPLHKVQYFPLNKVLHFPLHKVQHFPLNKVLHFPLDKAQHPQKFT